MSTLKKTLIILIPGFPKDEADTTCLPMQQSFVRALKEQDPDRDIIVLAFQYPYVKKRYTWFGISVFSFGSRYKGRLARLLMRPGIFKALRGIHQSSEVTGLLSFWYGECALVGKRFADTYGLTHYCWIMGQDALLKYKYPGQPEPKSNELIAISDFIQDEFERNYGTRPAHVIPPGIDTRQFIDPPGKKDLDLLAAGSLLPLKQYDVFIEMVAEIKQIFPTVKAMLIGSGPEKGRLSDLAMKLDVKDNISFVGQLPYPEVLQMMQRAKVFLHPSSYEGFSGVCLEALSAGCPVVSLCRAMKPEIGQWHIVNNKTEMKERIISILSEPAMSYRREAIFPVEETARKIRVLFTKGK